MDCGKLFEQAIGLIYPPLCLCCQQRTGNFRHLFCSSCLEHLNLLDPQNRCQRCFAPLESIGTCPPCRTRHFPYKRHAAACEHFGPPLALLSHFRRGDFSLAKTIASLMVMQHESLGRLLPDRIIPYPTHIFPSLHPQGKLTRQVALSMARMMERPVCMALKKAIDFAYFTEENFRKEPTRLVRVKDGELADKKLLLVSLDTDAACIAKAANLLQEVFPSEIVSLSFLYREPVKNKN